MSTIAFIPIWVFVVAAIVAGLLLGSFLNVCIVRLPKHQSIVVPASHCLHCSSRIRALDNVPVLSWIALRGRCRFCRTPISILYPLVELGTAALFVVCFLHSGATWTTLVNSVACFLLLGLAVMDAQTMLLPDTFTLSGIAIAFLLKVSAPGATYRGHIAVRTLEDTAIAAGLLLFISGIYWIARRREGLGMGDVKLLGMIAAFLGLPLALFSLFIAVLAAAIFAIVRLMQHRIQGSDRLPFGSFLAASGIVSIFLGTAAIEWYLSLFR